MPQFPVVRALLCALIAALCAAPAAQADLYSEQTGPTQPAGAMLVIHGGGWQLTGVRVVQGMRLWAQRFDDRYRTWNVDDRPGGENALDDVTGFYDGLRALATRRDLACVISEDGPTDLTHPTPSLADEKADALVPVTDAVAFAAAYPDSTLVQLDPGTDEMHVHSMVSTKALADDHALERGWVDAAMRRWSDAHPAAPPVVSPRVPAAAPTGPPPAPTKHRTRSAKHRAKRSRS
jgi:hypothetical protein